jgi:hypothetical protein
MRSVELWQAVNGWMVAAAVGLPVLGKIIIVCVALRGARPAERPKIISALAQLFGWRRRGDAGGRDEEADRL